MDSVSCSLKEVDIYALSTLPSLFFLLLDQILTALDPSSTRFPFTECNSIELGDVQLAFESEVWWDLDALTFDSACWMSHQNSEPASTSRVGILSSSKIEHLLENLVDRGLRRAFKLLTESSSVLYNHDGDTDVYWKSYSLTDLANVRSIAGTLVVQHLERALKNLALAKYSLRELKALFLIVFGTIIAVGYSKPVT